MNNLIPDATNRRLSLGEEAVPRFRFSDNSPTDPQRALIHGDRSFGYPSNLSHLYLSLLIGSHSNLGISISLQRTPSSGRNRNQESVASFKNGILVRRTGRRITSQVVAAALAEE